MLIRTVALLLLFATPALADRKVALVIGNSAYLHAPALSNPKNDAAAVAAKLRAIGYEVQLEEDLTGQAFRVALGAFSESALHSDLALVFYAGHGIEMGGQNFLIPIDSEMKTESTAQFETVPLDQVLSTVRGAGTMGIVMLDACRDNPFANSMTRVAGTRSASRGLAPISVEGEGGIIVSFAAQAGSTAADGDGAHSPYTEAFLEVLDQPNLEVGRMFRTVRAKVRDKSGGKQVPVEQAQLPDRDVFVTPQSGTVVPVQPAPAEPQVATPDATTLFYEAARENDAQKLHAFVASYPNHARAEDARKLIESLEDDQLWDGVVKEANADAYRRYILVFPNGKHLEMATRALAELSTAAPELVAPKKVSPTFDCAKAASDVERAICASPELAEQDRRIAAGFKRALGEGRTSKAEQRNWLKSRESECNGLADGTASCTYAYTAARIVELGG